MTPELKAILRGYGLTILIAIIMFVLIIAGSHYKTKYNKIKYQHHEQVTDTVRQNGDGR